jgi:tetratricopeptide (TPR) repeat protein
MFIDALLPFLIECQNIQKPMGAKYSIMTPRRFPVLQRVTTLLLCAGMLTLFSATVRADALQEANRLIQLGEYGPALKQTEQVLKDKPRDAQARFLKGLILTEMNRHNDAIREFTRLTEDYPELPEPYNNLAVLYAQQRQYEKAKHALEMAIRTHPSYATAHENLGDIYARMASQAYDKALQIDSSNASAQSKLALIRNLVSDAARPSMLASRSAPDSVQAASTPPSLPVAAAKTEPSSAVSRQPAPKTISAPEDGSAAGSEREAEQAIRDWAAAWSRKDLKAYFAAYAHDFRLPGKTRSAWETERTRRIDKPAPIMVRIENIRVSVEGDRAAAVFRQHYQSGSLKTATTKTLQLVRRDGRWLIQQERIAK